MRDVLVAIGCGMLSACISLITCGLAIDASFVQSRNAIDASIDVAQRQAELQVKLDQLQEWRKTPNLIVLRQSAIDPDRIHTRSVQATIQNTGGRHAVLYTVGFRSESVVGHAAKRPVATIDSGVQSKVIRLEIDSFEEHTFNPPITIPPGEVLTIQICLPRLQSTAAIAWCKWNAPGGEESFDLASIIFH